MMSRITKWVIAAAVLIMSIAAPQSAHACTTWPDLWRVEIISITPDDSALPDGLRLERSDQGIVLRNDTEIAAAILSADTEIVTAQSGNQATLQESQRYLLIEGANPDMVFEYVEPSLPDEINIIVEHGDAQYLVPAAVTYNVEFDPMDEINCPYERVQAQSILFPVLIAATVGAGIYLIWKKMIKDRRAES